MNSALYSLCQVSLASQDENTNVQVSKSPQPPDTSSSPSPTLDSDQLLAHLSHEFSLHFPLPTSLHGEFSCWLMRNEVLMKGRLYLLNEYICFYARVPQFNHKQSQHSGFMSKRGRMGISTPYWFVLNGTNLSYYTDARNLYYPVESIDLRTITEISLHEKQPTRFKIGFDSAIITNTNALSPPGMKSTTSHVVSYWKLASDSPQACQEWFRVLKEAIFLAQNANDDVRLVIPVPNLVQISAASPDPAVRIVAKFKSKSTDDLPNALYGAKHDPLSADVLVEEYTFAYFGAHDNVISLLNEKYPIPDPTYIDTVFTSSSEMVDTLSLSKDDHAQQLKSASSLRWLGGFFKYDKFLKPHSSMHNSNCSSAQNSYPASPVSGCPSLFSSPSFLPVTSNTNHIPVIKAPPVDINLMPPHLYSPVLQPISAPDTPIVQSVSPTTSDSSQMPPKLGATVKLTRRFSTGHHSTESMSISDQHYHTVSGSLAYGSTDSIHNDTPCPVVPSSKSLVISIIPDSPISSKVSDSPTSSKVSTPSISSTVPDSPISSTVHSPQDQVYARATFALSMLTKPRRPVSHHHHRKTSSLDLGRGRIPKPSFTPSTIPNSLSKLCGPFSTTQNSLRSSLVHSQTTSPIKFNASQSSIDKPMSPLDTMTATSMTILKRPFHIARWGYLPSIIDPQFIPVEARSVFQNLVSSEDSVLAWSPAYLLRTIPRYGQICIGDAYIAFQSIAILGMRSVCTVRIPISDIITVAAGTSIISSKTLLVTAQKEDLCFEFPSSKARDAIWKLLANKTTKLSANDAANKMTSFSSILHNLHVNSTDFFDKQESLITTLRQPTKPQPMRITILTIGSRGDVQPFMALAKGLQHEGHHVRIATHSEYQTWIEEYGIEFAHVSGEPSEIMQLCVDNQMFSIGFFRQVFSKFGQWIADLLESAWTACQGSDLIIEAAGALGAGYHIAERLEIPVMRAFMMPWTKTNAFPHPFAPVQDRLVASTIGFNKSTFTLAEQVIWTGTRHIINRWRANTLGLPAQWALDLKHVPFIYGISPTILPTPKEWPDWVHVCGYWFLPPLTKTLQWTPPTLVDQFLAVDPSRTVYIGFGSIVVHDPDELSRVIVCAVQKANVRAIVCKGWSARIPKVSSSSSPVAPSALSCDSILELDSVPHEWLFPKVRGVVHHGGSGTCAAAFRSGVPSIIRPFFGDQYFWASRVEELGIGIQLRRFNEDKLASALQQLVSDANMHERAKMVSTQINQEDGVGTAIRAIYRDLEYAKSLIPRHASFSSTSSPESPPVVIPDSVVASVDPV